MLGDRLSYRWRASKSKVSQSVKEDLTQNIQRPDLIEAVISRMETDLTVLHSMVHLPV